MKSLLCLIALSISLTSAAANLSQLVGTFEISHPQLPVVNVVTLEEDGSVTLTEQSHMGSYTCTGSAELEDDILESDVTCDNGLTFSQSINLSGVKNFDEFTAPVFSSLYGMEFPMNFKRLK